MSLPYKFNTEFYQNTPAGVPMSTSIHSFQYVSQQGANAIYYNKSTMDAYYKSLPQLSNNPPTMQFKSHQERLAYIVGRTKIQCKGF